MTKTEWKAKYTAARKLLRNSFSFQDHKKAWLSLDTQTRLAVCHIKMPVSVKVFMYLVNNYGRNTSEFECR